MLMRLEELKNMPSDPGRTQSARGTLVFGVASCKLAKVHLQYSSDSFMEVESG
jgi:hypothetical protein